MATKIGNSVYVTTGNINRLNRKLSDGPFINNFIKILQEAIILHDNGIYNKEYIQKKFPTNRWAGNVSPTDDLLISSKINPTDYIVLQYILKKLTGTHWEMDKVIDFLINWFIYVYKDSIYQINKKNMPFYLRDRNIRKKRLELFESRFKKYYKNIMKID